jgi:hypothetical protein
MNMSFEMNIMDIFHLSSGLTVFSGPIIGTTELIRGKHGAKLLIDGLFYQNIEVNGESVFDRKHPEGHRAISTLDKVPLTSEFVKEHSCVLVSKS